MKTEYQVGNFAQKMLCGILCTNSTIQLYFSGILFIDSLHEDNKLKCVNFNDFFKFDVFVDFVGFFVFSDF